MENNIHLRIRSICFVLILFIAQCAYAQNRIITGVVTDNKQEPLIGVNVMVKGNEATGTITDIDGSYRLSVPSDKTVLVFSYIGYIPYEVTVGKNSKINVILKEDTQALDEVVVIGYGTVKRRDLTGAIASVKGEQVAANPVSNVAQALQGRLPGVNVISQDGRPGATISVRVRGGGSITQSNEPLYVVDGFPVSSIDDIPVADIESIDVLKDASSTAIYGARGANGVVLITTKRGTAKEAVVTVDAKWGSNSRAVPQYNVMKDPAMYYETAYKALYNSKAYAGASAADARAYALNNIFSSDNGGVGYQVYTTPNGEDFIGADGRINPNSTLGYSDGSYYYTPDDWYDNTFNKGNLRQEYNATVSGASDKINYYFSLGYLDDAGIISGSGFTRYTGRSKVDYQAKKWLKVGANMAYTYYDSK